MSSGRVGPEESDPPQNRLRFPGRSQCLFYSHQPPHVMADEVTKKDLQAAQAVLNNKISLL
jgi:hypothetical protein